MNMALWKKVMADAARSKKHQQYEKK